MTSTWISIMDIPSYLQASLPTTDLAVIKVGGSLLDWSGLPSRLLRYVKAAGEAEREQTSRSVLIVGAGPVGALIRTMDSVHGLGDERAHWLALHALDLSAELLGTLLPGSVNVDRPELISSVWNRGRIPILAPRRFVEEIDFWGQERLPASWDVTTDSIAARIAHVLGARRLILLKSARLTSGISREEAARRELVDRWFPTVARDLKTVEYVSLRDDDSLPRILSA
jgi:5-(aminomethyl)-3-furanmethanol phosphate kinase